MTNLEIGRIGKPHGLRGEISAIITSDRPERTAPGAVWHLPSGDYTIVTSRKHQQRWIVQLEGVVGREGAEAIGGSVITAEAIDDPDALWVHELVGADVRTPDGRSWGAIASVLANPAHEIFELVDGTLVPEVFVVDSSALPEYLVVDPPVGILPDADQPVDD